MALRIDFMIIQRQDTAGILSIRPSPHCTASMGIMELLRREDYNICTNDRLQPWKRSVLGWLYADSV